MNQESSRSHSVFTCVIESQWVSDSLTSFRYGRLNLVDLAGSERQKASGAEGERLREAANINKSLSTLGLVIMILVDLAQGKQRHVPYRDSKLTFLLQDSLGGNSKTAVIATVSPAISCANETLSTLKFAQRAKFIQNNAVINEDASGDVKVLQSQIQELTRELEKLREQIQLSRSLPLTVMKKQINDAGEQMQTDFGVGFPDSKSSHKDQNLEKLQAMEELLAGSLSREQDVLQEKNELAAEILQLNSLIQAYERDMIYVKTMLQLKEEKIQRLERVEDAIISAEDYLQEDNRMLQQELCLLKDRMNKHPELLRFALENKHLIQQLRRHDELYGEERETLMAELANLRHQVLDLLQDNVSQPKQGKQMMASTQDAGHDNEGNQTTAHNNFNEEAQTELVNLLEEGNQVLNEALQEVENIQGIFFTGSENQLTISPLENTVHIGDEVLKYSLQQLYDIAKDVQDRFRVLCSVPVIKKKKTRSECLKELLPNWIDKRAQVKSDLTTITNASEYCKINENCSPPDQTNEVPVQQCRLPSLIEERLFSEEDCESRNGEQSCEALGDGASANAQGNLCLHLRSKLLDFSLKVAERGGIPYERKIKNASVHRPAGLECEAKQQVCSNLVSRIHILLAMMQVSFDTEKQKRPIDELNDKLDECKHAFEDDAHQTCMKGLTHVKVLIEVQKQLEEICEMLEDEAIRFDALCTLTTGLKAREKQWLSEKVNLKHQLLRLQSDAVAKDKEIAALQNEEAILAAIVHKLHNEEEGMTEELIDLKHHLEYSENQRIVGEQLYEQKLQENKEDQIKARHQLQKLVTEVHNNNHTFINVKKQMEIALASLRGAEISRKKNMFECTGKDKKKVDSLEKELEKADQSVEKELMMMETGMTSMLAVLEGRLQEAEDAWKGEKGMILLDLDRTKLDAAEKIGEASDALERFKHGQEIIREAELVVNALTKANEDAKIQKLSLMHQWHEERESMVTKIGELKRLVVQKEGELEMKEQELKQVISKREKSDEALQETTVEILPALQSYDKSTSMLLEKLEGIVATLSGKPGGEDAWVRFLNSFKHALSKLDEDANSCLSFSNVMCKELDKTLAEKQSLEEELERKKELLKGSFFDLSLLQESTAKYINMKSEIDGAFSFIQSLQEEIDIKNERLKKKEIEYDSLEHEKMEDRNRLLNLETSLSKARKHLTSIAKENADTRQNMEDALRKIESLEASLKEKRETIENLELELLDVSLLAEQRMTLEVHSVKQELSLSLIEKDQLQTRLLTLEEELDATRLAAERNNRLADEAQQVVETCKCQIQQKEIEVKILEKSIHELEDTINALENQMEILKREVELQQLCKEDLEMDLQALRHQQHHDPSCKIQCSEDTKRQQEQIEIMILRKEITVKSAEIKSLKLQVEELISAAEKQAVAHHQKLASLEDMADNLNLERGHLREASPTNRKAGDRNVAKCSTSPFKCLSSGLAQQINSEMDEELYSNRCRIDELEDVAASRQKEIFRLNKKLAEAETMTYDVIRDLLGVKSDIATHASYLDHKDLVRFSKMATHHTKEFIYKEKELEALRDRYNEERASWLEDTGRRQAEVVAASVAAEKLRHKDFLLKAENKRLKADLSRRKKRMLEIQDKLKASAGKEKCHDVLDIQHDDDLHVNHVNDARPSTTVDFER